MQLSQNPVRDIFRNLFSQSTQLAIQLFGMMKKNEYTRAVQVDSLSENLQDLKFYVNQEKTVLDKKITELKIENDKLKQLLKEQSN